MMRTWTGEEAKALRHALRFSVRAFAEHLGLAPRTISKWEAGGTAVRPRPDTQSMLDTALERADGSAQKRFWLEVGRSNSTACTVGSTLDSSAGHVQQVVQAPHRADGEAIATLKSRLAEIDQHYDTMTSAALLAETGQCHAQVRLLLRNSTTDSQRRDLLSVLATSATLLGQLVWDASGRRDDSCAFAYYDETVEAATTIGDVVAESHAKLRRSFIYLYGHDSVRDPRAGGNLAQVAADISGRVSLALSGLSWLHVGEARAICGEYRLCEQALAEAEQRFEDLRSDDVAHDLYSPSQFGRVSGSAYLFLGSPEKAEPILRDTALHMNERQKSRSLVLGNLALSEIRQRRLDEGAATLHEAIDLLEQTRGAGGLNVAYRAGRELSPWRADPVVHDVTDRLLSLMATG